MARTIGILHRTKKTAAGEARPTMIAIKSDGATREIKLETEVDELDFVHGRFPTGWREIRDNEDEKQFPPHHVRKERKRAGKPGEIVARVPSGYEGLMAGDTVVMYLGGSGDRLAFALSKRGEAIGAFVFRTPPFRMAAATPEEKKSAHTRLIGFYERSPEDFYPVTKRDRDFIRVFETFRAFKASQRDRIACDQRLRQRGIGAIFLSDVGMYPEGRIEDEFDAVRANSAALAANEKDETGLSRELAKLVRKLDVWQEILANVDGCGEILAAAIITGIGNIRRFRSFQDIREIARLREEIRGLEQVGKRSEDADKIERMEGENHFIRTGRIARWKREHGKEDEARALYRVLELMKEVSNIREKFKARLKAYAGVHVLGVDGKKMPAGTVRQPGDSMFPRQRRGIVANWSPQLRQALYLLGDQFVKRPEALWGLKYRDVKRQFRAIHPEIVKVPTLDGEKQRYTDGHIHKMAIWRSVTLFVVWFAESWMKLEERQ